MKKYTFYLSASLLFSPVVLAYDVMINITGRIADNSCDVVVENIIVPIGDVALKTFTYPGQVTGTTAFAIELPHSHSKRNKVTHWPDPDKITVLTLPESLLHAGKTSDSERTVLHRKAAG